MSDKSTTIVSRRAVLSAIGIGTGLAVIGSPTSAADTGIQFTHGIASGDPQATNVILWTRALDTSDQAKNIHGMWEISASEDFSVLAGSGPFNTGPKRDYTVKIDASGLQSGTQYFYRFSVGDVTSPVGRTKTLPTDNKNIDLAIVSCSNYGQGFFHVYGEVAKRDYQAVVHLGDYIYEYAEGGYDNPEVTAQGRNAEPKTEILSLEDYRKRYALYRTDPDLLAAHAAHPFICVWDDHEVANDTWKDGAQNHSDDEGDFKKRQSAAFRAYMEWLPIRESDDTSAGKIYRTFEMGTNASLIMLDTRHIGRDRGLTYGTDLPMRTTAFHFAKDKTPVAVLDPAEVAKLPAASIKHITVPFLLTKEGAKPMTDWDQVKVLDPAALPEGYTFIPDAPKFAKEVLGNSKRSMLGAEQEGWFSGELAKSKAKGTPWQIIGQQLLIGKVGIPQLQDSEIDFSKSKFINPKLMGFFRMLGQMGLPMNLDAWDGYPAARDRVLADIKNHANNAVFLAGDTHNAWAFDVANAAGDNVAVEMATPGISSPGFESFLPADTKRTEEALLKVSPEMKYVNANDRGWMNLTITSDKVSAQWYFVSTVTKPDYEVSKGPVKHTLKNTHTLA
ncbi:MAG: alkaline phosphatase D family protein [Kordiimonadaceae bacterium]|nr:alkaline phosphatase D family protein [Kordiimonadaceae bacterium]